MKNPKVSIIASSFNTSAEYLLACVDSIINQTFEDFEFFIVDDCSVTNKVEDVLKNVKDKRIKIIKNEQNQGLAVSLNKCIMFSKGQYIVRMDTDDIAMQDRLERQIKYMDDNPLCDIMSGRTCLFTDSGKFWIGSTYYGDSRSVNIELFFDSTLLHPSIIIRKSFLEKNNLFYDPECRRAQDYNLWVRSSLVGGDIRSVEDYYIFYRQHENAASKKDRGGQIKVILDIHKQYLEKLAIDWNSKTEKIHECFCNPYEYDSYDVKSMVKWAKYLIKMNTKAKFFKTKDFQYGVIKRLLGGIQLQYAAGHVSLKDMFYVGGNMLIHISWFITTLRIVWTKRKQKKKEQEHYLKYIKEEWERVQDKYLISKK